MSLKQNLYLTRKIHDTNIILHKNELKRFCNYYVVTTFKYKLEYQSVLNTILDGSLYL